LQRRKDVIFSQDKNSRCYTFMIIPHSQRPVMRVRIPISVIKMFIIWIAAVIVVAVVFAASYLNMKNKMTELYQLRMVNKQQKKQLHVLEQKTSALSEKMSELKNLESEIREMLDLEEEEEVTSSRILGFPKISRGDIVERKMAGGGMGGSPETILSLMVLPSGKIMDDAEKLDKVGTFVDEMDKQIVEMKARLIELKKDIVEWKDFLAAKPSIWPVYGRITSGFGYRRSPFSGRREFHPGVDIGAPYGSPVRATGDGVVQFAGYKSGYGLTVIIKHGYGFKTLYAHNCRLKVRVGQKVKKGDVVAYVGNSGRSTGPHVHYEVHVNGRLANPVKYLQ